MQRASLEMPRPTPQDLADAVLDHYPRTYGEQLGIGSLRTPSPLFKLLVMALLMSARMRAGVAFEATKALFARGWTTARAMADSSWEERVRTLNQSGYARYDERTATMLADTATLLLDRYDGDLQHLRAAAGTDPAVERALLKHCKGIGDVGVDIFFREAQQSWPELFPFADRRALQAAERLGLGSEAAALLRLVNRRDFARLITGLVRTDLDDAYDEIAVEAMSRTQRRDRRCT
jgi:endonuclease III